MLSLRYIQQVLYPLSTFCLVHAYNFCLKHSKREGLAQKCWPPIPQVVLSQVSWLLCLWGEGTPKEVSGPPPSPQRAPGRLGPSAHSRNLLFVFPCTSWFLFPASLHFLDHLPNKLLTVKSLSQCPNVCSGETKPKTVSIQTMLSPTY